MQRPRVRLQQSLKDYKALQFYYGSSFMVLGLNALLNLFTTHFSFFYPLKHNRGCSLKGFSFLLVFSVLHKNFVSPECKQCAF